MTAAGPKAPDAVAIVAGSGKRLYMSPRLAPFV